MLADLAHWIVQRHGITNMGSGSGFRVDEYSFDPRHSLTDRRLDSPGGDVGPGQVSDAQSESRFDEARTACVAASQPFHLADGWIRSDYLPDLLHGLAVQ